MSHDSCEHCTVKGDFDSCVQTPCVQHHSWFARQLSYRASIQLEPHINVPTGLRIGSPTDQPRMRIGGVDPTNFGTTT